MYLKNGELSATGLYQTNVYIFDVEEKVNFFY